MDVPNFTQVTQGIILVNSIILHTCGRSWIDQDSCLVETKIKRFGLVMHTNYAYKLYYLLVYIKMKIIKNATFFCYTKCGSIRVYIYYYDHNPIFKVFWVCGKLGLGLIIGNWKVPRTEKTTTVLQLFSKNNPVAIFGIGVYLFSHKWSFSFSFFFSFFSSQLAS